MANKVWIGGAQAIAQVENWAPDGVQNSAVYTLGIAHKSVSYTADADDTIADVVAALVAAWEASEDGEIAEVTATDGTTHVVLTGPAGVPFVAWGRCTGGSGAQSEVQTVVIANATGGTYTLTYDGQTTAPIDYGASTATVQAALIALSNLASGDVVVTGSPNNLTITFGGTLASTNVAQITADAAGLTAPTPAVNVSTVQPGHAGTDEVQAIVRTTAVPTGGTWTVSFNSQTTSSIAGNADAAAVQAALEGITTIGAGNVLVTDEADRWRVQFTQDLGISPQNAMTVETFGTFADVVITQETTGCSAQSEVQDYAWADAMTGEWTANFGSGASSPIPVGGSISAIESSLGGAAGGTATVQITGACDEFTIEYAPGETVTPPSITTTLGGVTGTVTTIRDASAAVAMVQKIKWPAQLTGGSFTASVGAATTSALAYNVSAPTFQTALRAVLTGGDGVSVATTGNAWEYLVTFNGADYLGLNVDPIVVASSAYRGVGSATVGVFRKAVSIDYTRYRLGVRTGTIYPNSGTFSFTVGGVAVSNVAYNVSAATLTSLVAVAAGSSLVSCTNSMSSSGVAQVVWSDTTGTVRPAVSLTSHTLKYVAQPAITTPVAGAAALNEQQTITFSPVAATGGSWTISYNGQTTSALQWNADNATVKNALEGTSALDSVNVTGSGLTRVVELITPAGDGVKMLSVDDSGLVTGGATPTISADVTQQGRAAADEILRVDTLTGSNGVTNGNFSITWPGGSANGQSYDVSDSNLQGQLPSGATVSSSGGGLHEGATYTITWPNTVTGETSWQSTSGDTSAYSFGNVHGYSAAVTPQNHIETVTITGYPDPANTWTLTIDSTPHADLDPYATPAELHTALGSPADLSIGGVARGWIIEFIDTAANAPHDVEASGTLAHTTTVEATVAITQEVYAGVQEIQKLDLVPVGTQTPTTGHIHLTFPGLDGSPTTGEIAFNATTGTVAAALPAGVELLTEAPYASGNLPAGDLYIRYTTPGNVAAMTCDASAAYVPCTAESWLYTTYRPPVEQIQAVQIPASTRGSYTIGWGGTLATIAYDDTVSEIQTKIRAKGGPMAAVTITGAPTDYHVEFASGTGTTYATLTVATTGLGYDVDPAISTTQEGFGAVGQRDKIEFSATPTTGTWSLDYGAGVTSGAFDWNVTPALVGSTVAGLSGLTGATATGAPCPQPFTATFGGLAANTPIATPTIVGTGSTRIVPVTAVTQEHSDNANQIWDLIFDTTPDAGTWSIQWFGSEATSVAYNATTTAVRDAIIGDSDLVTTSDLAVTYATSGTGCYWRVEFQGNLAAQAIPAPSLSSAATVAVSVTATTTREASGGGNHFYKITGTPVGYTINGGTWSLICGGQTASIPYNATVDDIRGILEDLSTIGEGNVLVFYGASQVWDEHSPGLGIEYVGDLAGTDVVTTAGSNTLVAANTAFTLGETVAPVDGVAQVYTITAAGRGEPLAATYIITFECADPVISESHEIDATTEISGNHTVGSATVSGSGDNLLITFDGPTVLGKDVTVNVISGCFSQAEGAVAEPTLTIATTQQGTFDGVPRRDRLDGHNFDMRISWDQSGNPGPPSGDWKLTFYADGEQITTDEIPYNVESSAEIEAAIDAAVQNHVWTSPPPTLPTPFAEVSSLDENVYYGEDFYPELPLNKGGRFLIEWAIGHNVNSVGVVPTPGSMYLWYYSVVEVNAEAASGQNHIADLDGQIAEAGTWTVTIDGRDLGPFDPWATAADVQWAFDLEFGDTVCVITGNPLDLTFTWTGAGPHVVSVPADGNQLSNGWDLTLTETAAPVAGVAGVYSFDLSGVTSGTFALKSGATQTADIAYNATPGDVQTSLTAAGITAYTVGTESPYASTTLPEGTIYLINAVDGTAGGEPEIVGDKPNDVTFTINAQHFQDIAYDALGEIQEWTIPCRGVATTGYVRFKRDDVVKSTWMHPIDITAAYLSDYDNCWLRATEYTVTRTESSTAIYVYPYSFTAGGTFALRFGAPGGTTETTSSLAYNASSATVQARLEALDAIAVGDVTVADDPVYPGGWQVTLAGQYLGRNLSSWLTVVNEVCTGPAVTLSAAITGSGTSPAPTQHTLSVSPVDARGYVVLKLNGSEYNKATIPWSGSVTAANVLTAVENLRHFGFSSADPAAIAIVTGNAGGPFTITWNTAYPYGHTLYDVTAVTAEWVVNPSYNESATPTLTKTTTGTAGNPVTQTLTFTVPAAATMTGTFTLTVAGTTTGAMAWSSDLRTALGQEGVVVVARNSATQYVVEYPDYDTLAAQLITGNLTGIHAASYFGVGTRRAGQLTAVTIEATFNDAFDRGRDITAVVTETDIDTLEVPYADENQAGGVGDCEEQTVSVSPPPTGGTYRLQYGSYRTSELAYNANNATILNALNAATGVTWSSVTGSLATGLVCAGPAGTELSDVLSVRQDWLTTTPPACTVTPTTEGRAAANETQLVELLGSPTTGTWALLFGGNTTSDFTPSSVAADIQASLTGLTSIGSGNVIVEDVSALKWRVTFQGALAATNVGEITATAALTGDPWGASVTEVTPGVVPSSGQQSVVVSNAGSGSFTLTSGGLTTNGISPTADASAVESALEGLASIGTGNVAVSGGGGSYSVTFQGDLANQPIAQMAASAAWLNPLEPTVTTATSTPGHGAGGMTQTVVVVATGPNHWDNANNWEDGSVPVTGDAVHIFSAEYAIKYGLAQSAVLLSGLYVHSSANGVQIGLSTWNDEGYVEYRGTHLQVGATIVEVERCSGLVRLDTGSGQTTVVVHDTAARTESDIPSFCWIGTHTSNVFTVNKGDVGVAYFPAQTSHLATLRQVGGILDCGKGLNLADGTVDFQGGTGTIRSNIGTLTMHGQEGDLTLYESSITAATIHSSQFIWMGSGTIATCALGSCGKLSAHKDARPKTITNMTYDVAGGTLYDYAQSITFTYEPLYGTGLTAEDFHIYRDNI